MKNRIKLDIISDVVCPWCTIGYKRLEKAIAEMGIGDKVDIEWQPFELNPDMPAEGEDLTEHLTHKYGASAADQKKSTDYMVEAGNAFGFTFDYFEGMRMVNTREAHILLAYAKEQGMQTELKMAFTKAFFSDRKDVSDRNVLRAEVQKLGLNADEAMANLDVVAERVKIQEKENYWRMRGVSSVPTVVVNGTTGVNGAQPVEVYKQILSDLVEA